MFGEANEVVDMSKVLTADEMRKFYGAFYEQGSRQRLNAANVPEGLRLLLPYAEFWGILDDWSR